MSKKATRVMVKLDKKITDSEKLIKKLIKTVKNANILTEFRDRDRGFKTHGQKKRDKHRRHLKAVAKRQQKALDRAVRAADSRSTKKIEHQK